MPVPTDEKASHVSTSGPTSPTSKSNITPKPSPAARDAPLTKTGTVSKGTQPSKNTSPKNSPSKNSVPTPTVSGTTPLDGTKKVRRKGSKPIINWFQRKIAGRKPPPPHPNVPGFERGRDPGPRHPHGASHSRSVGPAGSRKKRSGTTAGDADGEFEHSLREGTSLRSRSLSPSLDPESVWSPSMQLEADDDASIRPLPPTSPPSPSPSNTTHLTQTTYSGYGSDPRTVGSHAVSTKPTTLLSVDIGLGQPAHIAQAHTPVPAVASPSSPQFGRFPSTRSAHHQAVSSTASVTFSAVPYPSSPLSTAPYFLAEDESQDQDASTQAPTHSLPHPRNNPRPSSPPLDNASTLTLASSTFNNPRQVEQDAVSASVRAIRRRGSWESGDSRWSAVVGLRRPGSTRTAGSWRTGGSIGGGIMLDQQREDYGYGSDAEDKDGEDGDYVKAENVPLPESPAKAHISPATPLSIQTDLPVAVEAGGARTSDEGLETAVPGRKSLEHGDETEKESNDGHGSPLKESGAGSSNGVKVNRSVPGKKVDVDLPLTEDGVDGVIDALSGGVVAQVAETETYGSPITNESPAFTDGTRPREPTRAAAASLNGR
ncbi:hypothetical protein FRC10_009279 [Ceratobasidium sp. 414]|nr:hypothetical protein FRC10_009279 [Ceratobasidium sp. 414]